MQQESNNEPRDGAFIPNSFQTPNTYVDNYMHLLTPEENTVLMYAVRRIFGFGKREDYISQSQFESGTMSSDGTMLDHGTGLTKGAISRAIDSMKDFGLIIEVQKYNPMTNTPSCYRLQMEAKRIKTAEMEQRLSDKKEAAKDRTKSARCNNKNNNLYSGTRQVKSDKTYTVGQDRPIQSDKTGLYSGTVEPYTVGLYLIENQLENQLENQGMCNANASSPAPVKLSKPSTAKTARPRKQDFTHGSLMPISHPFHVAAMKVCGVRESSTIAKKQDVEEAAFDLFAEGRTPDECEKFLSHWWAHKFGAAYFGKAPTAKDLRDSFDEVLALASRAGSGKPDRPDPQRLAELRARVASPQNKF